MLTITNQNIKGEVEFCALAKHCNIGRYKTQSGLISRGKIFQAMTKYFAHSKKLKNGKAMKMSG